MTHEDEFVIKLKFQDTYKAVANYIRNGLGIKKENVEAYLQQFAREAVCSYDFYPIIKDIVRAEMADAVASEYPSYFKHNGLQKCIEKAIRDEVKKQIEDFMKTQVKIVLKE